MNLQHWKQLLMIGWYNRKELPHILDRGCWKRSFQQILSTEAESEKKQILYVQLLMKASIEFWVLKKPGWEENKK